MDIIIVAVILVLVFFGLRSTKKHMKGEGECCGGGSGEPAPKKKKLEHVIAEKTVIVDGMTCDHCKNRVERCINDIPGAAGRVNLKKKEAAVSMEREISDEEIRTAIEKAGYTVVEIR